MSDNSQAFLDAIERGKKLTKRPSNEELLKLYGLYKQATDGDVSGSRPGGFDFKGQYKYDAWASTKGMSKEDAETNYIAHVDGLCESYA